MLLDFLLNRKWGTLSRTKIPLFEFNVYPNTDIHMQIIFARLGVHVCLISLVCMLLDRMCTCILDNAILSWMFESTKTDRA